MNDRTTKSSASSEIQRVRHGNGWTRSGKRTSAGSGIMREAETKMAGMKCEERRIRKRALELGSENGGLRDDKME